MYFLEANSFPDFKQTGTGLGSVISELFELTARVAIDTHFGLPCVGPAQHTSCIVCFRRISFPFDIDMTLYILKFTINNN